MEIVPPPEETSTEIQDRVVSAILERARIETKASGAALALETDGSVICFSRAGEAAPPLGAELDREAGISGLCLRTGEPVRCNDASNDPRVDSEAASRLGISSILAVPLALDGITVGLVEVFSASPNAFGVAEGASVLKAAKSVLAVLTTRPETPGAVEKWNAILAEVTAATPANGQPPAEEPAPAAEVEPPTMELGGYVSKEERPRRLLLLPVAALAVIAAGAIALSVRSGGSVPTTALKSTASQAEAGAPSTLERLQVAALQGEAAAQLELARHYRDGDGVERNDAEALRWLQEAARKGNADAQLELGNAYAEGSGVPRDVINAYACYVLAGANGNASSEEALRLLTPKLNDGQIAQVRSLIGQMYLQGRGTPVDYVSAYTWFKLAESAGSADGQRARQAVASNMTKQQIAAADRRATDWLKRHSPQPR